MSRPRLIKTEKFLGWRDWDSLKLGNSLDVEIKTHRDWEISCMSLPRLIKTGNFLVCQDWDSSKLRHFLDAETKTLWNWEIEWMSKPRPVETGQKMLIPRFHRDSHWSLMEVYFSARVPLISITVSIRKSIFSNISEVLHNQQNGDKLPNPQCFL